MAQLRRYRITITQYLYDSVTGKVTRNNPDIFVIDDLTADITVVKQAISQGGRSRVVLRNLSAETLDRIIQDRYAEFTDKTQSISQGNFEKTKQEINGQVLYPTCVIEMGYDDKLVEVFRGIIDVITPRREGTDLIADISLSDAGFYYVRKKLDTGSISLVENETTLQQALNSLYNLSQALSVETNFFDFANSIVEPSDLSKRYEYPTKVINTSGNSFNDLIYQILNEYDIKWFNTSNSHVVVNEGLLTFVLDYQNRGFTPISSNAIRISPDTGLLQPPVREGGYLRLSVLFNPYIKVGSQVFLESSILKRYNTDTKNPFLDGYSNGYYTVQGVQHNVRFSDTVNGQAVTEVKLYVGPRRFENRFSS